MKNCNLQKQLTRKTRRKKGFNRTPFCQKKKAKEKKGGKKLQRAHASLNWLEKKSEIKSKYKIK